MTETLEGHKEGLIVNYVLQVKRQPLRNAEQGCEMLNLRLMKITPGCSVFWKDLKKKRIRETIKCPCNGPRIDNQYLQVGHGSEDGNQGDAQNIQEEEFTGLMGCEG